MENNKSTFVKVINGVAVTDLTDKNNLVVMSDKDAKIFNKYNKNGVELIKVKITLDRVNF